MTITGVSLNKIGEEDFYSSAFWGKVENLFLVYYYYDSLITVPSWDYANFEIRGYQFLNLSKEDEELVKNDWTLIRDFIIEAQKTEKPEDFYPLLSSNLRKKLLVLDTAPKYPNSPRFRFKRNFLSGIVGDHFSNCLYQEKLTKSEMLILKEESSAYSSDKDINRKYYSISELEKVLEDLESEYEGYSLKDLLHKFNIASNAKNRTEQMIVKMFGGESKKINDIPLFKKTGVQAKTVRLHRTGNPVEATKLFPVDFEEMKDENLLFEDSELYRYFNDDKIVFIVFQNINGPKEKKVELFKGFVIYSFEQGFIDNELNNLWSHTRSLIQNNLLIDEIEVDKKGDPIINDTGVARSAPNFIKAKESSVFIRGTGRDSTQKNQVINGVKMYQQNVWLKQSFVRKIVRPLINTKIYNNK